MDKEVIVHIHNRIFSAIKRNTFESVLMKWMNLESIRESEMNQKEKDKYCILMAPHSSTLAWKIPWTEEPDGVQSMGLLRDGHN